MTTDVSLENGPPAPQKGAAAVWVVAGVLALVLLTVVGALGWYALHTRGDLNDLKATDRAGIEATQVARKFAVQVSSYDSAKLDQDFKAVLDGSTGDFYDQYKSASSSLAQTIRSVNGHSVGTVTSIGVVRATRSQVSLVAFVDQTVSNSSQTKPRTDRSRMQLTLVKQGGRWLVSELKLV